LFGNGEVPQKMKGGDGDAGVIIEMFNYAVSPDHHTFQPLKFIDQPLDSLTFVVWENIDIPMRTSTSVPGIQESCASVLSQR